MICNRCGHRSINETEYCYNCAGFGKIKIKHMPIHENRKNSKYKYNINYELTKAQQNISDKICETENNVLVDAVCGAGKTEIVLESISKALKQGHRVGFAIPRKEVVKEIGKRLKEIFSRNSVNIVHGESIEKEFGDITVFTTHQSYRFTHAFNLLVIDEVDAFPYSGNVILENITERTSNNKIIYLSATPPEHIIEKVDTILSLNSRFHKVDHPIPEVVTTFTPVKKLIKIAYELESKLIIFVPTFKIQLKLYESLRKKFEVEIINSKVKYPKSILERFRKRETKIIISTATLERGITFTDLDIIIYKPSHAVYTIKTLIQMSGRVGRKIGYESGRIILLDDQKSSITSRLIKEIKKRNDVPCM